MIEFYQGCKLEALADVLADTMNDNPPANVFDKQLVVVHSQGMARWLMQQLATHSGISANMDFCFPGNFLNEYVYWPHQTLSKLALR